MKKGALVNFTKFTGKQLCQSRFFNKIAGVRAATFLKKSLWHSCFPVNSAKFLRTPYLQNIPVRLLLILFVACFLYFPLYFSIPFFVGQKSTGGKPGLFST